LNAQVLLQDNFTYTTSNIEGHKATTGHGVWEAVCDEGSNVSTNGKEAVVSTADGKIGEGVAIAKHNFAPNPNTLYTLKVTFKVKAPIGADKDTWIGIGFSNPENGESDDPWMLIRPPVNEGDDGTMVSLHGKEATMERFGETHPPGSEYSSPITASIKWNSNTGEAQYYINGGLQDDCGGKTVPPTSERSVFFEGWQTGNILTVMNVTLTAEPLKTK